MDMQGFILPAFLWLGFPELGWHLVILMTVTLYVGNALKDLVSAPRPLGLKYGSIRLSHLCTESEEARKNAEEFGFPSSHTMNTITMNFYICHYLHDKELISDDTAILAYLMVTFWVLWIAFSRLYLGLHTPIDILGGAVAGLTVLTAFISLKPLINIWANREMIWIEILLICLVLLRLHPKPATPTPTFEFTTSFMGTCLGVMTGKCMYPAFYEEATNTSLTSQHSILHIMKILVLGFMIVIMSKAVSKYLCHKILPVFYLAFPLSIRRLWQPPVHDQASKRVRGASLQGLPHTAKGVPADVDSTARFFSYAGIGFAASYIAPSIFSFL